MMGINSLPTTVTRQHRGCYLNAGPTVPDSSMLTTRLPSHPIWVVSMYILVFVCMVTTCLENLECLENLTVA